MRRLKEVLRRLTGISTPLGGISWRSSSDDLPPIDRFDGPFCITLATNDLFIDFLERNDGKVIFMKGYLDASVALEEQRDRLAEQRIDIDLIAAGQFGGMAVPLPNQRNALVDATFYFREGHVLAPSSGGTGTLMVNISGFFEVSHTFHSGPSTSFHLKEIEAPLTLKARYMSDAAG